MYSCVVLCGVALLLVCLWVACFFVGRSFWLLFIIIIIVVVVVAAAAANSISN